jgi:methyl-accepting chemotaxis protein
MKNLKIGVRLGGGFAAVLLLLLSLTVVGIVQMQSASKGNGCSRQREGAQ